MTSALVPCIACARHVSVRETRCPFCESDLPRDAARRAIPLAPAGTPRKALAVFAATLGLAAAGCSSSTGPTDGATDVAVGADTAQGTDTALGTDASMGADTVEDFGGIVPAYGDPPPRDVVDVADDNGGIAPPYGIAPPRDE